MVNYCCVEGCGRNSRMHGHLKYYSLPKEKVRQAQWLKAAGREDLLDKSKDKSIISHRFCSRHFPTTSLKNIHLQDDAIPTLNLPGVVVDNSDVNLKPHKGVTCNNCHSVIYGFRYKCVTCKNFDLCQKCEMQEIHTQHYMLRMPKCLKFKKANNLVKKWQRFFNHEHIVPDNSDSDIDIKNESSSDDDQPINKYVKNYDSGVDLSDDVKVKIRKEVIRALISEDSVDDDDFKPNNRIEKKKQERKRTGEENKICSNKRQKIEVPVINATGVNADDFFIPELAFADVNNMKDVKVEQPSLEPVQAPMMHVKLSDDLTHLTIEMIGEQ